MDAAYFARLGSTGPDAITHIGLVNGAGVELTGGDPAYARQPVTWTDAALARPTTDLPFDIPPGSTVAGWRGYSAATGGTNYGGAAVVDDQGAPAPETYTGQGTYLLRAADTGILHRAPVG
ncbi:hypothetical protein [Jiangella muralis]|uniref:hypothetical protein n=1 Tax=Jiangella muralis TaxID=702383 RepID=UPI00069DA900|nr:hypothetical protein [Jiangella muralis]